MAHEKAWGRLEELERSACRMRSPSRAGEISIPGQGGAERIVFTGSGESRSYAADEDDYILIGLARPSGSADSARSSGISTPPILSCRHRSSIENRTAWPPPRDVGHAARSMADNRNQCAQMPSPLLRAASIVPPHFHVRACRGGRSNRIEEPARLRYIALSHRRALKLMFSTCPSNYRALGRPVRSFSSVDEPFGGPEVRMLGTRPASGYRAATTLRPQSAPARCRDHGRRGRRWRRSGVACGRPGGRSCRAPRARSFACNPSTISPAHLAWSRWVSGGNDPRDPDPLAAFQPERVAVGHPGHATRIVMARFARRRWNRCRGNEGGERKATKRGCDYRGPEGRLSSAIRLVQDLLNPDCRPERTSLSAGLAGSAGPATASPTFFPGLVPKPSSRGKKPGFGRPSLCFGPNPSRERDGTPSGVRDSAPPA
jgi:hypothetical protein